MLQIQTGMVAYVCFFDGATEDVAYEMGKLSLYSDAVKSAGERHLMKTFL